ncbi:MAG: hypothetical protein ACRC6E_00515 [Fusobacteriaceae bacterium]
MFKVGEEVLDTVNGRGVVDKIMRGNSYPIGVQLDCGAYYSYTLNGKKFSNDVERSLYKMEERVSYETFKKTK